jgi:hypothetical protein
MATPKTHIKCIYSGSILDIEIIYNISRYYTFQTTAKPNSQAGSLSFDI